MSIQVIRTTLLLEKRYKDALELVCDRQGINPSVLMRQFILKYVRKYGLASDLEAMPEAVAQRQR